MNPDVKQAWLDALRSGDYTQGQGALRDNNDKHCCLGVLCDISKVGHWEYALSGGQRYVVPNREYLEGGYAVMPSPVAKWAGLKEIDPNLMLDKRWTSLATLNDGGKTFDEIANVIEENL